MISKSTYHSCLFQLSFLRVIAYSTYEHPIICHLLLLKSPFLQVLMSVYISRRERKSLSLDRERRRSFFYFLSFKFPFFDREKKSPKINPSPLSSLWSSSISLSSFMVSKLHASFFLPLPLLMESSCFEFYYFFRFLFLSFCPNFFWVLLFFFPSPFLIIILLFFFHVVKKILFLSFLIPIFQFQEDLNFLIFFRYLQRCEVSGYFFR